MTDATFVPAVIRRRSAPVTAAWLSAVARAFGQFFAATAPRPESGQAEREAAAVRALAYRYRETDRGFAADLYAAADRHEEEKYARQPGSAADRRQR